MVLNAAFTKTSGVGAVIVDFLNFDILVTTKPG